MKNYKNNFIGDGVKEVKTQEDTGYHLATKYGYQYITNWLK